MAYHSKSDHPLWYVRVWSQSSHVFEHIIDSPPDQTRTGCITAFGLDVPIAMGSRETCHYGGTSKRNTFVLDRLSARAAENDSTAPMDSGLIREQPIMAASNWGNTSLLICLAPSGAFILDFLFSFLFGQCRFDMNLIDGLLPSKLCTSKALNF